MFIFFLFLVWFVSSQCQRNGFPRKSHRRNDLLCIEREH